MEPLSTTGVVANIAQLVDAAVNAFTVCHEIYQLGQSTEDSRMASTSEQLFEACEKLGGTLDQIFQSRYQNNPQTLQAELIALREAPGSGLRGTIQKAWLKKRKAKTVGKLKFALDEYEKTLDSKILVDVRQILEALDAKQQGQSKQLEQDLSRISSDLKACQSGFPAHLRLEIDKYVTANETQHEVTREHVRTHITAAMEDISLSHTEHLNELHRQQYDQQQYHQFINSLWFKDMHTRMNEITDSHSSTFHWIFEDDATGPWDSFST
ncbi:MAG: hypothetical protein Q9185_005403 [Variospora sp. 1 TL-2023]